MHIDSGPADGEMKSAEIDKAVPQDDGDAKTQHDICLTVSDGTSPSEDFDELERSMFVRRQPPARLLRTVGVSAMAVRAMS
eukprot:3495950-Pyramimonas_sp.AAC.1